MTDQERRRRLLLFAKMVDKACGLSCWCFGATKKLYTSTSPAEKEFLLFLNLGQCLDYAIEHAETPSYPLLMSDPLGMLWVSECVYSDEGLSYLVILGPVFNAVSSLQNMRELLHRMNVSAALAGTVMEKLETVPLLTIANLRQYIKMLHWVITNEEMEESQLQFQFQEDRTIVQDAVKAQTQYNWDPERARVTENLLLQMIREGNIYYHKTADSLTTFADKDIYNIGDPLRENKNIVLIYVALCARAAMDGGLSPRTAKELETYYIRAVEQCSNTTELININRTMMDDFVQRVHRCKESPRMSRPIQECCAYIQTHLLEPLSLQSIAHAAGYTEYYLSKKFKRETGMRPVDYIKQARIQHACILLESTNKSIQEISEDLHFSSRSYFSTVFQSQIGVSPATYRRQRQEPNRTRHTKETIGGTE